KAEVTVRAFFLQGIHEQLTHTLDTLAHVRQFLFPDSAQGVITLTKDQVLRLREEFGVYAVASGRVNVAGMTPDNMAPLCEAIVA
ncbi:aminotransferase class I/II-fold pyridoxal phosphate-dependent enzyme, partial [Salmonella enterica subsp. enterica serovar Infantis]